MTMLRPAKSITTVFLLLLATSQVEARYSGSGDAKRRLATELIANSDRHKDYSLQEVLERQNEPEQPVTTERTATEKRARYSGGHTITMQEKIRTVQMRTDTEKKAETVRQQAPPLRRPRTLSELFAWAIRMTTSEQDTPHVMEEESVKEALPPPSSAVGEAESLAASVRALSDTSLRVRVRALVQLEELCHSVDNGRDMAKGGGVEALSSALLAEETAVRSAAALAMATCAQNNPSVMNKTVEADCIPRLARLAAYDGSSLVRARALFALNAVLELHEARAAFESEPAALPAVHRSLRSARDARATRRGLNLCELLVAKNLEVWKPMLEAWDIPVLIERLMREHRDIDVRESAARVIASLDGRVLS